MRAGVTEFDEHGDLRFVDARPGRRLLPRRRKPQRFWSEEEVRETVVVAYVGRSGGLATTAIVMRTAAKLFPRREVRSLSKELGFWPDYEWWGFAWTDDMWEYVCMGDAPVDLIQARQPRSVEHEARDEARQWAGNDVVDVGYFDMPTPARRTLHYALRHPPG